MGISIRSVMTGRKARQGKQRLLKIFWDANQRTFSSGMEVVSRWPFGGKADKSRGQVQNFYKTTKSSALNLMKLHP
jgi:hypothetical protein